MSIFLVSHLKQQNALGAKNPGIRALGWCQVFIAVKSEGVLHTETALRSKKHLTPLRAIGIILFVDEKTKKANTIP